MLSMSSLTADQYITLRFHPILVAIMVTSLCNRKQILKFYIGAVFSVEVKYVRA